MNHAVLKVTRESENKIIHRKEKTLSEWKSDFVNEKEMKKKQYRDAQEVKTKQKIKPISLYIMYSLWSETKEITVKFQIKIIMNKNKTIKN